MIYLDAHVHLYDTFHLREFLHHTMQQLHSLNRQNEPAEYGVMLTERPECSFFKHIANGLVPLPSPWEIAAAPDSFSLQLSDNTNELWLFSGRQMNAAERLEISAFGLHDILSDGQPLSQLIDQIRSQGALPCLNWAFGKWLFKRGQLIQQTVNECRDSGPLLLCDSSLRFTGWPEPAVFQSDLPLLAGTDPLPVHNEQYAAGSYGCRIDTQLDSSAPWDSLKTALCNSHTSIRRAGARNSLAKTLLRQLNYYRVGRSTRML